MFRMKWSYVAFKKQMENLLEALDVALKRKCHYPHYFQK